MSGHSKWAQIKRQKGAADVKRGTLYTKLSQAIASAAREGGRDPEKNVKLHFAIEKAREANMPNATIERARGRTSGMDDRAREPVLYEAFCSDGTALLIQTNTDNRNRTTAAIRHVLEAHGGALAGKGSVMWRFRREGERFIPLAPVNDPSDATRALLEKVRALPDVTNVLAC